MQYWGGVCHKRHERDYIGIIAMSLFVKFNDKSYTDKVHLKTNNPAPATTPAASITVEHDRIGELHHRSIQEEGDSENDDISIAQIDESKILWQKYLVFPTQY